MEKWDVGILTKQNLRTTTTSSGFNTLTTGRLVGLELTNHYHPTKMIARSRSTHCLGECYLAAAVPKAALIELNVSVRG
jgi:hypothetical protein